jgi:hypothetical protein
MTFLGPRHRPGRVALALRPLLLAWALITFGGTRLSAQARTAPPVSPFLPIGHWAVDALRRLDTLGQLETPADFADRSMGIAEVARAFELAAVAARQSTSGVAELAEEYRERFAAEFPLYARETNSSAGAFGRVELGFAQRTGALHASTYGRPLVPPTPAPDRRDWAASGRP